jgi:bla regulator protein BlaR1
MSTVWNTSTILVGLFVSLLCGAPAAETADERDFSAEFGSYSGAFVLYDGVHQHWLRYHPEQCRVRTTPMSTFKVLNSLIALETGVASGPDFSLPWDGTHHPIEPWNHDQTLRSAFSVSCVWYFQALAKRVGLERYQQILPKVGYGNGDVTGGVTHFWLMSSLTISPDEQVEFLRRLHTRKLPFSDKTVDTVLDIMTLSRTESTVFRGKTGTAGDADKDVATLGWFIGSVTTTSGDYFFATRITGGENPSGRTARKIAESILATLKILPSRE